MKDLYTINFRNEEKNYSDFIYNEENMSNELSTILNFEKISVLLII